MSTSHIKLHAAMNKLIMPMTKNAKMKKAIMPIKIIKHLRLTISVIH